MRRPAETYMEMSSPAPEDALPPSPQELPSRNESKTRELPRPPRNDLLSSSPPRPSTYKPSGRKERRDPSVTPRKFRRFFTPRTTGNIHISSARQALHEITGNPTLNRHLTQSSPLRPFRNIGTLDSSPVHIQTQYKRRKLFHTPELSPEHGPKELGFPGVYEGNNDENVPSSPCQRAAPDMEYIEEEDEPEEAPGEPLKRIKRLSDRGISGQMLNMRISSSSRSRRQHYEYPVSDWQDHTAPFYSKSEDVHMSMSIGGTERTIPFCAAGLHTNSLVAVADEQGNVRLLESARNDKSSFHDVFLAFRVHTNAVIDMTFSEDDSLLATASGDQSARVVDMATQTTISILGNHTASLKQARFQPGANNNSVLATSSRDGSIQIWDLRVNGYDGPSHQIYAPVDSGRPHTRSESRKIQYTRCINAIYDAHKVGSKTASAVGPLDAPSRGEVAGRLGDVSVTAIQFLGSGLDHLLVSASEADSSIKLWDIRSLTTKRKTQTALSVAQQPQSHSKWRHFGVSSLNMSSDGSRLYSLCKDNTIYAYSTAHLMLGHAPELSSEAGSLRPTQRTTQEGLGPLYGFRHPQLHATSFYVKSAIRKPKDGKCEMLAVGSSDGCAILFPTDERYLTKAIRQPRLPVQPNTMLPTGPRQALRKVGSGLSLRASDSIPISENGTALIRGHDREVGSLTWTSEGNLVTVGDDYLVRTWREDAASSRDLRTGGETEGRRWGCGWANVAEKYDDDDDDDES